MRGHQRIADIADLTQEPHVYRVPRTVDRSRDRFISLERKEGKGGPTHEASQTLATVRVGIVESHQHLIGMGEGRTDSLGEEAAGDDGAKMNQKKSDDTKEGC